MKKGGGGEKELIMWWHHFEVEMWFGPVSALTSDTVPITALVLLSYSEVRPLFYFQRLYEKCNNYWGISIQNDLYTDHLSVWHMVNTDKYPH